MVTGKGVNNHTSLYVHILDTYTSWGPLYPHSRSNHGTETLCVIVKTTAIFF